MNMLRLISKGFLIIVVVGFIVWAMFLGVIPGIGAIIIALAEATGGITFHENVTHTTVGMGAVFFVLVCWCLGKLYEIWPNLV